MATKCDRVRLAFPQVGPDFAGTPDHMYGSPSTDGCPRPALMSRRFGSAALDAIIGAAAHRPEWRRSSTRQRPAPLIRTPYSGTARGRTGRQCGPLRTARSRGPRLLVLEVPRRRSRVPGRRDHQAAHRHVGDAGELLAPGNRKGVARDRRRRGRPTRPSSASVAPSFGLADRSVWPATSDGIFSGRRVRPSSRRCAD